MERFKAGDVIGWSGYGLESCFINLVTWGVPCFGVSHVGIMAEHDGELLHFESTTLSDLRCVIQGRKVKGMQAVKLADRINSYPGRAYHYPLYRPLYDHESRRLTAWLVERIGQPYDTKEAIEAGGLFGILTAAAHWSRMLGLRPSAGYFCSQEDADALSIIGVAPTDDGAKWNPNHLVRSLRRREILLPPRRLKKT